MTAKQYYEDLAREAAAMVARLDGVARRVSWLRVALFVITVSAIYLLWHSPKVCWIVALAGCVAFVGTARYHDLILRRSGVQRVRLQYARSRLMVLAGDLSQQPRGEQYVDAMHRYSYDLDIFGRGSLFSMLDSTSTPMGTEYLAEWLKKPLEDDNEILERQKAVAELSRLNSLRDSFHASGKSVGEKHDDSTTASAETTPTLALPRVVALYARVAWVLFATGVVLVWLDVIPGSWLLWLFVAHLAIAGKMKKQIDAIHSWLCSTVEQLTVRETLFRQIETARFSSPLMQRLQHKFNVDSVPASRLVNRLARKLKALDQRYNAVGFMLFNGVALWDLNVTKEIKQWFDRYGDRLPSWRQAIGEVDALCALATYAFENPGYVYPRIDSAHEVIMSAEELGHPLIHIDKRVDNPLPQMGQHSFMVVTGANMAGKSTYLRTIGVNYLLAMMGAPVAAKAMTFTPARLFTGLRANDSLADGESYFFAELKRLRSVVREASGGTPMFILLDEILRGTNSADKQRGSIALVKKLITLPVAGVLATHDLALGELAREFPQNISAHCFEARVEGDTLKFDYRLHHGVAHNLNAYYLMEKMEIV